MDKEKGKSIVVSQQDLQVYKEAAASGNVYHGLIRKGASHDERLARRVSTVARAAVASVGIALMASCATVPNMMGNSYTPYEAQNEMQVQYGKVVGEQNVTIRSDANQSINGISTPSVEGAAVGSVVGGLVGSQLGNNGWDNWRSTMLGSTVGAVGGAIAGNAIANKQAQVPGVQLTVKMDSGKTFSIVQQADPNVTFSIGERVAVVRSAQGKVHVSPE